MFRLNSLKKYLLLGIGLAATPAFAQSTFVPWNQDVYHLIDRYHIKYGEAVPQLHTAVKPYEREEVADLAEAADSAATDLSQADRFNIDYLLNDNWNYTDAEENESRKPLLKYFYRNKTDLYHYAGEDFTLRINPVLHLEAGRDPDTDGLSYINTRGVQVEGSLDDRIGFYTFLGENQAFFPSWVNQRIARDTIVPHEAYWKEFKDGGYDFFTARGYVNVRATKHVSVQFGHDQNFKGDGYRSLLLSDYAPSYFFLKLNTQVWKLNYQNIFAEMIADHERRDQLYPKKYMAMHHLSINVLPNLNFGVYEAVVFARDKGQFELQYLNPIIFYRSVEQWLGSEDNAIVGANFKWNIKKRAQLYGQLMLDEFLLSEVRAQNGWWANKQAFQLGAKYIDVAGIKNLDAQAEYNYIRP
ncbi:MAG: hypothetical protein LPK19_10345, partial [Hymenobacteraceae bacterium]|nr:hypothetical protein [Hymenobacteraceae bacterium]MDX5396624.1 hypothetical protein [Hymenobacteraceae bacterium]MDX5512686.1 hypothetical protein [Hymenobacteraceae bacterium]